MINIDPRDYWRFDGVPFLRGRRRGYGKYGSGQVGYFCGFFPGTRYKFISGAGNQVVDEAVALIETGGGHVSSIPAEEFVFVDPIEPDAD